MVQVNVNYLKLKAGYLFPEIAKRVKLHSQKINSLDLIKLGIGDVTEPLPKACIEAMNKALPNYSSVLPEKVKIAFQNGENFHQLQDDYSEIKQFILSKAL